MLGLLNKVSVLLLLSGFCANTAASGLDEVNYWREKNGLYKFKEDKILTQFAQMKAEYRAKHKLHDGHQGPKNPKGTTEGTGEVKKGQSWGFLVCCLECDGIYAGAGVAIGAEDNQRYMVLVVRKNNAKSLINPNNIRVIDTEFLTPNPPVIKQIKGNTIWKNGK